MTSCNFVMTETGDDVVVHHANRLHEGIADGRADEAEPTALQIAAHDISFACSGRHVAHRPAPVLNRSPVDELPEVPVETAELVAHFQKGFGVVDGGADFQAVA